MNLTTIVDHLKNKGYKPTFVETDSGNFIFYEYEGNGIHILQPDQKDDQFIQVAALNIHLVQDGAVFANTLIAANTINGRMKYITVAVDDHTGKTHICIDVCVANIEDFILKLEDYQNSILIAKKEFRDHMDALFKNVTTPPIHSKKSSALH